MLQNKFYTAKLSGSYRSIHIASALGLASQAKKLQRESESQACRIARCQETCREKFAFRPTSQNFLQERLWHLCVNQTNQGVAIFSSQLPIISASRDLGVQCALRIASRIALASLDLRH